MIKKEKQKIVILGAGLAGLSSAFQFKKQGIETILLEKTSCVGGTAKTVRKNEYLFDLTGHALHLSNDIVKDFIFNELNLEKELVAVERKSVILMDNEFIPYPFQYNVAYLDEEKRNFCVIEFLKAYYKDFNQINGINTNNLSFYQSFEQFCYHTLGKGISNLFMIPYNEKLWATRAKDMGIEWMGKYVPKPNFKKVIEGAFIKKEIDSSGYNAQFYYPKSGGIQTLSNSIYDNIRDLVLFNQPVTKIDLETKEVFCGDKKYNYQYLISSIPLYEFLKLINLSDKTKNLKWNVVRAFFVAVPSKKSPPFTWIYIPDSQNKIYRIGNFSLFSSSLSVNNEDILYIECSASYDELNKLPTYEQIADEIEKITRLNINEVKLIEVIDICPAYPIYDLHWKENVNCINKYLKEKDVIVIGRYGSWKYESMEDSIMDGINAANIIIQKGDENGE